MPAGLYVDGESFLHRTGALAKLPALVCWFVVALTADRFTTLVPLLVMFVLLFALTGTFGVLARFARFMILLLVMCAVLWSFFSRSGAGLREGGVVGLRLAVMLTMGLLMLACTRIEDVSSALRRIGVPFRAAFALTLAFRLVPLFGEALASIVQAQRCRGLDPGEGGPITRIRRHLPLMVPLILSSLRSADRLAMALESRGFGMRGEGARTSIIESRFGAAEAALVAVSGGAAAAVVALVLWGHRV